MTPTVTAASIPSSSPATSSRLAAITSRQVRARTRDHLFLAVLVLATIVGISSIALASTTSLPAAAQIALR
ncbi:MAG: hypothetical protein KA297_24215 [Kofleriaceae bacterium]|nr:hypothetical protein [Kofleriaceae bacterium]